MITLKSSVYHRLLLQAQEARDQGMHKLAAGILNSIGPTSDDETSTYSYSQMQDDVYEGLWKLANHVIKHYDVDMVDAERLDQVLETLAYKLVNEVEEVLPLEENTSNSPLDLKVPGES